MSKNINFMLLSNELNELLKSTKEIVVVDARAKEEYEKGHIYNAVNIPEVVTYLPEGISTDKEKKDFIDFFQNVFSKAGIGKNELVVFYEDKFTLKSPRGLTILKYLGYDENNIKVLDGGYYKWCESNFKTTTKNIKNTEKKFIANVDESFFVDYNEMLKIIYDENIITLDVRDKDEWIGISSSPYGIDFAPKKGRLPNAVWIEWYKFITNDMLSVGSLEKIKFQLHKNNINIDDKIVLYCFKGARLSNTYIAMRKLGYKNIRIYFAGWNEWCRKDGAPIINEVENTNNPILQENIALKKRLAEINLKEASLIDFPKYNKEPVFAFDRDGNACFENHSKLKNLSSIKNFTDIFPDADTSQIYNIIDNKEEKRATVRVNGNYYLFNFIGSRNLNKILVYAFDVTELKKSEQELKKLKIAIEQSPISIVITDVSGNLEYVNPQFLEVTGYTKDEVIGVNPKVLASGYTTPQEYAEIWDKIHRKKEKWSGIFKNIKKNGDEYWESAIISPIVNDDNEIINYIGVKQDISDKIALENQLKDQGRLMIAQSRHAAMGEMISMIAHQWRQPLSSIAATSANIQVELELESYDLKSKEGIENARKHVMAELRDIDTYVQSLSTTIDDFRNFYKENKKSVSMKLENIIDKSVNIIKSSLINDNIKITREYNSNQDIQLYDSEMMQVILNLLKNSQDNFSEKKIKSPNIKITTEDKTVTICDNGGGISDDIIEKIFDPYFSTKNEKNGTGLGLYMSKTIVEDHHNGTISVKNTDDGVCFILSIGEIY